jgi:hypothetical protein
LPKQYDAIEDNEDEETKTRARHRSLS